MHPYYLSASSPFFDAGSVNDSALAGFYHYTSFATQKKELNTPLNLGFHLVALTNGAPIDTDGDLLPDVVEDINGNGVQDGTETSWTNADTDGDGLSDYGEIYVYHSDPLVANSKNHAVSDAIFFHAAPAGVQGLPLYLHPPVINGNTWTFQLDGAPAGNSYTLYFCPDVLMGAPYIAVARGGQGPGVATTSFTFFNPGGQGGDFEAGSDKDDDLDGLTSGDEIFLTHSLVDNPDSDNDGYSDGPLKPVVTGKTWSSVNDFFPRDRAAFLDTDGDGKPDSLVAGVATTLVQDDDSDNDGTPDNLETQAGKTDPNTLPAPKWYVNASGPANGDGSQALPFPTIQAALNAAANYDIIQVANGTYSGAGNYPLDFQGKKVRLASEKGFENTVLDATGSANAFHFHTAEGSFSWVVGFTIMNASASAVLCDGANTSSNIFLNCVFTNNGTANGGVGGGISCINGNPKIVNCKFLKNGNAGAGGVGGLGGAVYASGTSRPLLSHCTLLDNVRVSGGGQIHATNSASVGLTNSVVWSTIANDQEVVIKATATVNRWFCDIKGAGLTDGYFLISTDPLLEPSGRLTVNSPCIDHGRTNCIVGYNHLTRLDMDGEARLQIQAATLLYTADIGADEYIYRLQLPLVTDETTGTGPSIYSFIDEASGVAFLGENGGYSKIAIIDDEVNSTNFIVKIDTNGQFAGYDIAQWYVGDNSTDMKDIEECTYDPVNNNVYMISSQTKRNHYVRSDHDAYPWQDPPTNDYDQQRTRIGKFHLNPATLTWDNVPPTFWSSEPKTDPTSIDYDAANGLIPYITNQVVKLGAVQGPQHLGPNVMIARNTVNKFTDPVNGVRYAKGALLDPNCANCGISLGDTVTTGELAPITSGTYSVFTLDNNYNANLPVAAGTTYYFKIWAFLSAADRQYTKTLSLVVSNAPAYAPTPGVIPKLIINESDPQATPDWIEVYNPGNVSVNIANFKVKFASSSTVFQIPTPLPSTLQPPIIPARGFLVLNCNNCKNPPCTGVDLNWSIADGGDEIRLEYSDNPGGEGTIIDKAGADQAKGPSQGSVWDGGLGGAKMSSTAPPAHQKSRGVTNNMTVYKYFDATSDPNQATPKIYLTWKNIGEIPAVYAYSPKQQDNYPINIEGFAYRGGANPEMIVGLRAPLSGRSTGYAIYFRANPVTTFLPPGSDWSGVATGLSTLREVNLNGQGIRAISWYPAHNTYLIIGGPSSGGPLSKETFNEKFSLYSWDGQPGANGPDGNPLATPLKIIDDLRIYTVRPEGVAIMTMAGGTVERVVFTEDRYHQAGYAARNVVHWPISILGTQFQIAP